jgi:hypothetical protein
MMFIVTMLLCSAAFAVSFGLLYPVFVAWLQRRRSAGSGH